MLGTFETTTCTTSSALGRRETGSHRAGRSAAKRDHNRPLAATEGRSMHDRLPSLVDNASNFRRLARQYRNEARLLLHTARLARERGDVDGRDDSVLKAREARSKAAKCDSFANLCEIRAATIASMMGSLTARRPSAH